VKSARDVIIRPVVSEKSYAGIERNAYTFLVAADANKTEIKEAVQQIWNVHVLEVNTMNRKGKVTRGRRTNRTGSKPDTKRALVKLAAGHEIPLFES
jgi:large subunit ribosomal protein L23